MPFGALRLSLVTLAALFLAQVPATDVVLEPSSRVAFPTSITPPGSSAVHQLAGTAIRTKTIFRIKVYAFGLYVDPEAARSSLAAFGGMPADRLAKDEAFYQRLLDLDAAMTLRLVMTRDVGGSDVADSFDDALTPRVRTAAAERGMPGGAGALATFRTYFNLEEVAKGTEIVFACGTDGRLSTRVGIEPRPDILSPALCWALFDVYLGPRPVSKDGKATVIARIPDILASRSPRLR